jgi:hypothetical protein
MRKRFTILWAPAALYALAVSIGSVADASSSSAAPAFSIQRLELWPTQGRVGYHYVGQIVNRGCEPVSWTVSAIRIEGELPPGLQVSGQFGSEISGTPRQPGTWVFRVIVQGARCNGSDPPYADGAQSITLTIDP